MRITTVVLMVGLLAGYMFPAAAIGARTHAEIAYMAVDRYLQYDAMLPGLAALFDSDDNMRALYSGCALPDWGYGLGHGAAAEYSHWHPFMERYAALLQERFPPPWMRMRSGRFVSSSAWRVITSPISPGIFARSITSPFCRLDWMWTARATATSSSRAIIFSMRNGRWSLP